MNCIYLIYCDTWISVFDSFWGCCTEISEKIHTYLLLTTTSRVFQFIVNAPYTYEVENHIDKWFWFWLHISTFNLTPINFMVRFWIVSGHNRSAMNGILRYCFVITKTLFCSVISVTIITINHNNGRVNTVSDSCLISPFLRVVHDLR